MLRGKRWATLLFVSETHCILFLGLLERCQGVDQESRVFFFFLDLQSRQPGRGGVRTHTHTHTEGGHPVYIKHWEHFRPVDFGSEDKMKFYNLIVLGKTKPSAPVGMFKGPLCQVKGIPSPASSSHRSQPDAVQETPKQGLITATLSPFSFEWESGDNPLNRHQLIRTDLRGLHIWGGRTRFWLHPPQRACEESSRLLINPRYPSHHLHEFVVNLNQGYKDYYSAVCQ